MSSGSTRSESLNRILRESYIKATTNPGNLLDRQMLDRHQELLRSSNFPLSLKSILSRTWFYIVLSLMAAPFGILGALNSISYEMNWESSTRYVQLDVFAIRNSSSPPVISFSDAGLLLNGCKVNRGTASWVKVSENTAVLDFGSPRQFNGWYFATADGVPALDPASVALYGSLDNSTWHLMGAGAWTHTNWGRLLLWPEGRFDAPLARRDDVLFDLRAPWAWLLANVAAPLFTVAGLLSAAAAGLAHRARGCAVALAASLLVLAALYAAATIGGAVAGLPRGGDYWFGALWACLLPLALARIPPRFAAAVAAVFGALLVAASLCRSLVVYGLAGPYVLYSDSLYVGVAMLLLSASATVDRWSDTRPLICCLLFPQSPNSTSPMSTLAQRCAGGARARR